MENIIRQTIFDNQFPTYLNKVLRNLCITIALVCVCTLSVYVWTQHLHTEADPAGSGTCAKYTVLRNQATAIKKPLIETALRETTLREISLITATPTENLSNPAASPELPEISMLPESDTEAVPLPGELCVEEPVPSDEITSPTLYSGFVISETGMISGCVKSECNLEDGLLVLPLNEKCTGVDVGAFDGITQDVTELFIPKNITYIAPGSLDSLTSLMYIQVMDGNPAYYSEKGCLYSIDGSLIARPAGRI